MFYHWGLVMVIPLLGVKTRCADKSAAEHYNIHTYILQNFNMFYSGYCPIELGIVVYNTV